MKVFILKLILICSPVFLFAQKKPLDHSVYDQWQSVSSKKISNDGKYVVFTVSPQEGDGETIVQSFTGNYRMVIPRGYNTEFTEDSRFVILKIRPYFKALREARIKKLQGDNAPKDSLAIIALGKDSITKIARVKNFKIPRKPGGTWLSYHLEKNAKDRPSRSARDTTSGMTALSRTVDSLLAVADSLRNLAQEIKIKGMVALQVPERRDSTVSARPGEEGTELVLHNLVTGEQKTFTLVSDYYFNEKGTLLIISTTKNSKDSLVKPSVVWVNLVNGKADTIFRRFNEIRNLAIHADGAQLAFIAERDSVSRSTRRLYKLWYYKPGLDSAKLIADTTTMGIAKGLTVNENVKPLFSKDGKKLFFSLSPIRKAKDTSLVEFETARLDIWNYKDDYLQPQQLVELNRDLRRGYLAVMPEGFDKVVQLGGEDAEEIRMLDEGNSDYVLATTTRGNRIESQWLGFESRTAFLISTSDGTKKKVVDKQRGAISASPQGRFIWWYDASARHYFTYNVKTGETRNITKSVPDSLFDDEDDHPDDPPSYGTGGWVEKDNAILVNSKFDVWQVDPSGLKAPVNLTNGYGKKNKIEFRTIRFDMTGERGGRRDSAEVALKPGQQLVFSTLNKTTKYNGFYTKALAKKGDPIELVMSPHVYMQPQKAENANAYLVTRANVSEMDVYTSPDLRSYNKMSSLNPQQKNYNWMTSQLVKWKMFDGREAEGLLFKPENFDSTRKYPVMFYFYERNADGLYTYRAPAPSASTINVPFFASNEYLVFIPDIYYKTGQPGEDAYNSVVSAARNLAVKPWVDSSKMAIQGQSWGGYQVAYLVTRTNMFAAAGAGAPVANMTSAYGGIRWGTGRNRQFQYERTQSRIGATLWEKPNLYIKNSPLFTADKITTPLLIMHNDADGAVPWYQGIELFTALRRLGKQVWMLQYNGEDHNLVERRNRKDLSIRLSQFFDHFLKGAPPAKWIEEGVPATQKGLDWGLEVKQNASTDKKGL